MISPIKNIYANFLSTNGKVCTDTRKEVKGSFFVCLKGENHDANLIAEKAMDMGAAFVLTSRIDLADQENYIIVEDTLVALQNLATYHRQQLGIKVIAIGGSNGKTTTKELLYSIFELHCNVHVTPGNFNNHIGVPLTLLQLKESHELAIVELGINHPLEMTELCKIAEPNEGVLTNIGKEHLEGFGSIEGVAKAESELFDYLLKNNGFSYINLDDLWISNMSKRMSNKLTFGLAQEAQIRYQPKQINPQIVFDLEGIEVKSALSGDYNFSNILTAMAIAKHNGVANETIAKGIKAYAPKNNRSEWRETKNNKLLIDCYNANPSSMELAIKNVLSMPNEHKLLIVGDMLEMGSHAYLEHEHILKLAAEQSSDKVHFIFVGDEFMKRKADFPFSFYPKTEDYYSFLEESKVPKNQLILLKASRGVKLEKLLPLL